MKIAFLSFYSGVLPRGVETYVHELSNRLVRLGHDVTVYQCGPKFLNTRYKTVKIPNEVDWKKNSETLTGMLYLVGKVKEFTKKVLEKIDADTNIIVPTNGRWQSVLCKSWAMKNKKKIVIPGQSGAGLDDRINLFTFPDRYIALTKHQEKWANNANPLVKTVKIPNGVDLDRFAKGGTSALSVELPKPIILAAAALIPLKRLDLAIKAVSKLEKASLLLVGNGPEKEKLQALGDKLLPGRFKILSLPFSEMPKAYQAADLFTFPTIEWESFGIAMVEAMASGLAVVATDDPIRREVVGNAGLFIDPKDTSQYVRALEKALSSEWGSKPKKQAEKFSWDEIAKQYDKLFKELVVSGVEP